MIKEDGVNVGAIIFDVGGTLLHVDHDPQERALQRVALDGHPSLADFRTALHEVTRDWYDAGGDPALEDLPTTWIQHYTRTLERLGFAGDCAAAASQMEHTFLLDGWEVYGDTIPVLDRLSAEGFTLGVISNWPESLELTLERAGLHRFFSVIVGSGRVGYAKPRPEIFQLTAKALDLAPERLLYVGDSVEHDLIAARQAGLHSLLLDRIDRHPAATPRVRSLEDVLAHLRQLNRHPPS